MQKIFLYIFFAVFIYVSITSCEQAIRIDEKDYESKAVVFGRISADSVAEIFLTQSIANSGWVEESQKTQFIKDASIEIRNGSDTDLLKSFSRYDKPYYLWGDNDSILVHFYKGEQAGKVGKEYELSFEHKGKQVRGIATIPAPADPLTIEKKEITESDGFETWTYTVIQAKIRDFAGEANAYRLHLEYSGWQTFPIFDPVTNEYLGRDSIYQTFRNSSSYELDEQKDGEEIALNVWPYFDIPYQMEELPDGRIMYFVDMVISVETADFDLGKYFRSLEDQQWNSDDPLAEPVFLKSNIENGLGIFGGYSMSDTVHFRYVEYVE